MLRPVSRLPAVLLALAAPWAPLPAQLVPVRVVPIAEGGQFEFYPSANFGMGDVSIAVRDSLLDPFRNPALAGRVGRALYVGAPTFFSVTNDAGSGQTYPFGAIVRVGRTFVGGLAAAQAIDPARRSSGDLFFPTFSPAGFPAVPPGNETRSNHHLQGILGHRLGAGLTLAASGLWSNLDAIEGMDLLFTDSHSLEQRGRRSDVRLGILGEWGGHAVEAVALQTRSRAHYAVQYAALQWNPNERTQELRTWSENTEDAMRTTGLHVKYDRPVIDSTWRAGAIFTVNRLVERSAAYHEFMGIPRDPSVTLAYNVGLGLSRQTAVLRYAFDAILEPMWRRATSPPTSAGPDVLGYAPPRRDSYFKFANVLLRGGVSRDFMVSGSDNRMRVQFGTQLRNVNYDLEQHESDVFGGEGYHERSNSWREWTHSWGTSLIFPRFEFAYQLRMLSGLGRLNVPPSSRNIPVAIDIFPAPVVEPAVTLYPVRVTSHQIFLSWPIR